MATWPGDDEFVIKLLTFS